MTKKRSVWKKPPTFTSKKLDWLACVNFDRRLKQFPIAFKVAYVIANQIDETRNTAFISDAAIADKAGGISERQVGRSRKLLRDTGWLSWKRTCSANVYSLLSEHVSGVWDSITASNEARKERRRKRRSDWQHRHFTSRPVPKSNGQAGPTGPIPNFETGRTGPVPKFEIGRTGPMGINGPYEISAAAMTEQIGTGSKKVRGKSQRSLDLIEAMYETCRAIQPVTGRGVGYKLFVANLIGSMSRAEMQRVYRLLKLAREEGIIPWGWIVDENRVLEKASTWADPAAYARAVARSYRRDFWAQQPVRVQVWSEKGTVRGVLQPVLDEYAVGFLPVHGFGSATVAHNVAEDNDGRDLVILYVGDFDPSGLFMSEEDLPTRLGEYDGHHVTLTRIALTQEHVNGLPSFPAADKRKDPRYKWFRTNYGNHCWELDAMDPNDLRDCVESAIAELIEPEAWNRCEIVNQAEQESLKTVIKKWGAS